MRLSRVPGPLSRPFALLVVALVAGGCAAKSAEPMAPSSEASVAAPAADVVDTSRESPPAQAPAPSSAADEVDPGVALAEAEVALDRALQGAVASPARSLADQKKAEARPSATAEAESGDACEVACRALASMRRSADRLCGLASGDADRCGDARARVTRAESRVKERCPACRAEGEP